MNFHQLTTTHSLWVNTPAVSPSQLPAPRCASPLRLQQSAGEVLRDLPEHSASEIWMVPQNEWLLWWFLMVFIMENPIQMDGYYGGYYNEINGGTPKNRNSWIVCKWKILFFNGWFRSSLLQDTSKSQPIIPIVWLKNSRYVNPLTVINMIPAYFILKRAIKKLTCGYMWYQTYTIYIYIYICMVFPEDLHYQYEYLLMINIMNWLQYICLVIRWS